MPRQLTTPDRVMLLMSLVPYLIEHGPTPVAELAKTFDVEPRVLRRLVQFLGIAGVPGETRTYQHEDLFDIDWEALEQHDVVSLTQVVAVDDIPRFSSSETAALIAGLHALAPMLPASMREAARSTAEKLSSVEPVDARRASVSVTEEPVQRRLATITAAIDQGASVRFEYRDAQGDRTLRTVDPLLLGQSGGSWYLRAHCLDRDAERTFLVDRMREPQLLEQRAQHRGADGGSASPLGLDGIGFGGAGLDGAGLTARLRVRVGALHRIADFAPSVLGRAEAGWVRAEVELLHPAVAARIVQTAPGEIVVEHPASAREAVRRWADRALARYDA